MSEGPKNVIEKLVNKDECELKIENLVKRLLSLEKDWSVPGHEASDATRVEKIMEIIEKEEF